MALTLLSTKLHSPAPTAHVITRPRLLAVLERGLRAKLILVSAPAGAGKSTLLAAWLKQLDRPAAWLSLEPSDNDLGQFLLYFISALQQLDPKLGLGLPEMLQLQRPVNAESLLIRLTNDLAQLDNNLILVLDDYHVLSDQKIHDAVEFLLDHLPSQLCLVIATRTDPPLALSRLRVRNQLFEVRRADLRFDIPETTRFLNDSLGLELSLTAIARLEAHTEGWIAALQLAALSLDGRPDKEAYVEAFAGSHRFLVDYLVDEVLSRQPSHIQELLQRTAILERFTAPLCKAVTGQTIDAELLGQLEAANLFLISLDDERRWYRFHHLFAEFLQHRLRAVEADQIPALHLRASAWFEKEGWTDEAIRHAFLAADNKLAAKLIEDAAPELSLHWNNAQLIKYVDKLPLEQLPFYPRLCIFYCWSLTNTGQLRTLKTVLPLLEESRTHSQQPHIVDATVVTLEAYKRLWKLDFAGTSELCQRALNQLEPPSEFLSDEERLALVAATNLMAYNYLHSDSVRADQTYPVAAARSRQLGNFAGVANSYARWGLVKHQLGRLHVAIDVFEVGFDILERWRVEGDFGKRVVNVGELHLNLSRLLYEWNRLEEAETHIEQARNLNELSRFTPVIALAFKASFYLCQARGDAKASYIQLSKLDRLSNEVHPENLFHKRLVEGMAMELRLSLAARQPSFDYLLSDVKDWLKSRDLSAEDIFCSSEEGSYYILALSLMAQDKAAAYRLLVRLAQAAQADGRIDDLIRALSLQALATQSQGQAVIILNRALDLAEPEGYIRTFVDQGPAMQMLLRQVAVHRNTPYVMELLSAFPVTPNEPISQSSPVLALSRADAANELDWLEPLNSRETSVLRFMAIGNSHKQIAKELRLSPNTVRWYMQSLYAKLQVRNRTEAVNRARNLGLL
jgi:LuxR family maltose regulon positive regulatory protein